MIKTKIVTIKDGDKSLKFKVRQMPATEMEDWVLRVSQLAASADLGDIDVKTGGMKSVIGAIVKNPLRFISSVDYAKFKPLWDELLKSASKVDDRIEQQCDIENVDSYVSNFITLIQLRVEVLNLNFGFFSSEAPSESPNNGVLIQGVNDSQS